MGRGTASKGKSEKTAAPDWLRPPEPEAPSIAAAPPPPEKSEKKKKKRPMGDDDELDEPPKKGIQWKPLAFLLLMTLPGLLPIILQVVDSLPRLGIQLPNFTPNPYRVCLQEFYADWAPEKLGTLDETLGKYVGRERQLFGALGKKYGKKANFAKCVPKKE
jgi:hypothetical protein